MMDERPPGPLRAPFTVLYVVFADQSHVSVDILDASASSTGRGSRHVHIFIDVHIVYCHHKWYVEPRVGFEGGAVATSRDRPVESLNFNVARAVACDGFFVGRNS